MDLREQLSKLTWRGPIMAVDIDGPETAMPRVGGVSRVKVFKLEDEEHVCEYERLLNRISRGVAESSASELTKTPDGSFRLLVVWRELYMCAPDYEPAEARRVLLSDRGAAPVFVPEGIEAPNDDDGHLQHVMQEWLDTVELSASKPPQGEPAGAGPEEEQVGGPLVYAESADEIKVPEHTRHG